MTVRMIIDGVRRHAAPSKSVRLRLNKNRRIFIQLSVGFVRLSLSLSRPLYRSPRLTRAHYPIVHLIKNRRRKKNRKDTEKH